MVRYWQKDPNVCGSSNCFPYRFCSCAYSFSLDYDLGGLTYLSFLLSHELRLAFRLASATRSWL